MSDLLGFDDLLRTIALSQGNRAVSRFPFADSDQDRDTGVTRVDNLLCQTFRTVVDSQAIAVIFQEVGDMIRVTDLGFVNAGNDDLLRGQPERQAPEQIDILD